MLIKRIKAMFIICSCILLTACASAYMAQALQQGKLNFAAGYYREAFHQLLPLAAQGSSEAQYAVGYMYYYGYGVPRDSGSGVFWIKKSAEQHDGPAVRALEMMMGG